MMYSMVPAAAVMAFAAPAMADFYIYWGNTISSDPYLGGGYFAAINNNAESSCDDIMSNDIQTGWVGDASSGGVRCDGCTQDADSIADWDIKEFEINDSGITTSSVNDGGWITLVPGYDGDNTKYEFQYVNKDRDESGVITNSYCVRNSPGGGDCVGPNLSNTNTEKLFDCFTDITALLNP